MVWREVVLEGGVPRVFEAANSNRDGPQKPRSDDPSFHGGFLSEGGT